MKNKFMQQVRKHHIDFHLTEPERCNQSRVEGVIREIRKKWFRVMMKRIVPKRLWDYGLTEVCILQGICPLKDEWVFGCSLKTRLADQTKTQQLKWLWSNDTKDSTINQRLVEQNTRGNFRLEGSGSSTLDDTLRKQYLSSSDE